MLTVQCDFDDTITDGNVSTAIREAFAPDGWTSMEEDYGAGKYSVACSSVLGIEERLADFQDDCEEVFRAGREAFP